MTARCPRRDRRIRVALFVVAALLGACSSEREPAQQKLDDVNAVMRALAADASRYAPAQYEEAERRRAELQFSFDQKQYASVVQAAPAVLEALDRLGEQVARERSAQQHQPDAEWIELGRTVPTLLDSSRQRLESLAGSEPRGARVDMGALQAAVADAGVQWDLARAAFDEGRVAEAVAIARGARKKLEAESDALRPAASQAGLGVQ